MRILKLLVISIVFLFVVVLAISLLIPSHVRISRATNVKAEPAVVLQKIANDNDWQWHPGLDSATAIYKGEEMLTDYLKDKSAQPVYIHVVSSDSNQVVAEFGAARTKPVINVWNAISHPGSDSVTLQWYIDFYPRWYPWEKFASLMLEKSYGPGMEEGLTRLKARVEN